MKKVAIYIRVSTQEQAKEGYSIEAQKDKLISYCDAKSWSIYDIYIDGGYSGSNLDRPALHALLSILSKIDIVLVYKLDRLSRSQIDTLTLIENHFLTNGVDFVSLTEAFDTTSSFGRAMIGMLSVFAQLEREAIKERSRLGKEKRVKNGLWHGGGITATGYKYIPGTNELVIDDYEALQVKEIFKLYNTGLGYTSIADRLNKKGYIKNNGSSWSSNAIKRILQNPIYKGFVTFSGNIYKGNHEPIIGEELFDNTQKLFKKRSKRYVHESKFLLGSMMTCGYCGARIKAAWSHNGNNNSKYFFYGCYSIIKSPKHMIKDLNCPSKRIKMDLVEKWFLDELEKHEADENKLVSIYDKQTESHIQDINVSSIKKQIEKIDKQIDKILHLYIHQNFTSEKVVSTLKFLENQKIILNNELNKELSKALKTININSQEASEYKSNFVTIWNKATFEQKRRIIGDITKHIILYKDGIKIEWNV